MVATKLKANADNPSGITPLEFKVLVRPNTQEAGVYKNEKTGFQLIKPVDVAERDEHAAMEGELVAVSSTAFTYETNVFVPSLGSTVIFARYSGITIKGRDGVEYRLMNDKDIAAVRS